jgi:hypothetical protein
MQDTTYNGWTNYETWAVGLYLDGNYDGEGTYRAAAQLATEHAPAGTYALAEALEEFVTDALPELGSSLASDLLAAAVGAVDWRELAEHQRANALEGWQGEARARGQSDARAAASWITDGNTKHEAAVAVLQLAEDGDPALDDYLPRRPDLSGEFADDLTPASLAEEITGADASEIDSDLIDTLADAYEDGVSETFEDACVAELRQFKVHNGEPI